MEKNPLYESLLADLNKEFKGRARMITARDGSVSFIIKGQPAIMKDGIKESKLQTEDAKTTCVAVVQATDKRATIPVSNTQLGGFAKRALGSLTKNSLVFNDIATRTMYIPIPKTLVEKNGKESYVLPKAGKEVLELLRAENGNELKDRAFVTVESFNPFLVMHPGQVRRYQILKQEANNATTQTEREAKLAECAKIISSVQKFAYRRDENGKRVVDANDLVAITAQRKIGDKVVNAPVFTGHILLSGLTDISPVDKTEFDSFYVYRAIEVQNPDGTTTVSYVKGGISEESRLMNDIVDGVNEGETSIPSGNIVVKTDVKETANVEG